jgi:hypothetical protein
MFWRALPACSPAKVAACQPPSTREGFPDRWRVR